jgi:hypothetical protein
MGKSVNRYRRQQTFGDSINTKIDDREKTSDEVTTSPMILERLVPVGVFVPSDLKEKERKKEKGLITPTPATTYAEVR